MLDDKDTQILTQLRRNAREKLVDISKTTGIPPSTIHERLRLFKKQGLRMVSIFNYPRIHTPIHCWFVIRTKHKQAMIEYLQNTPHTNNLLVVSTSADIIVECIFSTFKQQHELLEDLHKKGRVQVYPVIEDIGRELVCPTQLLS